MREKTLNPSFYAICSIGVALVLTLASCQDQVEITREYTVYEPVYMSMDELRGSFEVSDPQPINERGKIYLYKHWILISDPGKGIHIINNADQESPASVSYIALPGIYDFSVRNDVLYADSYVDLVIIDVSNMNDIREVNRLENIFQNYNSEFIVDPDSGLVVDYAPSRKIEVTSEEVNGYFNDIFYRGELLAFSSDESFAVADNASPQLPGTGIGGSMATFTIVGEHLYILDESDIHTFDIANPDAPVMVNQLSLGWGIETLFPYEEALFVGAQDGMYILDNSNRAEPQLITQYQHIVSCDPVVVQDDMAYVTLRGGSDCRGGTFNQLEVIDVSDLANPVEVAVYPMTSPYGLGIDADVLFLCEGENGLKVFDASDDLTISENLLFQLPEVDAYDVIPFNNTLFLIGMDGLYQYDYSDPENMVLISKLEISFSSAL